ncbi:hypothetical protein IFM89_018235 [Coptis chinensis]|uniref:Uncharacterized protein n=1 Tax=Coptis chinensis TaxID=261450 RepID=A0A835LYK5_9MAGN|nr:hypothetical protein IFM89_018235 [Coptis chinensis]
MSGLHITPIPKRKPQHTRNNRNIWCHVFSISSWSKDRSRHDKAMWEKEHSYRCFSVFTSIGFCNINDIYPKGFCHHGQKSIDASSYMIAVAIPNRVHCYSLSPDRAQDHQYRSWSPSNIFINDRNRKPDNDLIDEFRANTAYNRKIEYREEVVKDGEGLSAVIKDIGKIFDLVMVGRHHIKETRLLSGLTEWNECPELGIVGAFHSILVS